MNGAALRFTPEPWSEPKGLMRPAHGQVHVRRVEAPSVSGGGIVIPETAKKKPLEGVVLAVGPGWYDDNGTLHPIDIAVGEHVMFAKYGGDALEDNELMLSHENVLAVIGTDGESLRAHEDNCILLMGPPPPISSLLIGVDRKAKHRRARIMVSGRGYVTRHGALVENTVKDGQYCIVSADAGQDYSLDITVPRHNKRAEFQELFGHAGDFRIVRESEILAVYE